ncbi:MAG TPA: hypothetical protein VM364_00700 [Vicinamibacterales bacterium]|nr:hypothetical protein [Vicinamibacterales bacterium]
MTMKTFTIGCLAFLVGGVITIQFRLEQIRRGIAALDVARPITAVAAQATPLATEADRAIAPLEISRDGRQVTFRGPAPDDLQVCVVLPLGQTSSVKWRECFTVGDVRRGRFGVK